MIDYNPAKKEIIAAKKCLEQMKSSTNHDDFEMHWRECLGHIEKSFSKLLCATKPVSGKFSSHFNQKFMLRKTDKTLAYLHQARNADHHSTMEISKLEPPYTTLGAFPGARSHYIKELTIDSTGKIAKYEGDPMIVEFHPATTMPITVRNQGKDYPPPTEHLGEKLVDIHPSVLAYLGIQFYEKWIDESCATFR